MSSTNHTYKIDHGVVRNPERGLVQFVDMTDAGDVAFVASTGVTLANARIRLDDYRERPIDRAFLERLDEGFNRIREAGLKLVLRFQYNIGSGKDAELPHALAHIAQLEPLLRRHSDIIAVLEAGFIGAWGEWHNSIKRLNDSKVRSELLHALLDALPADRSVQVRSPVYKDQILPGGPVTAARAYNGDPLSRVGHHNDCFLSGKNDDGTFPDPVWKWRNYVETDGQFVPVGGETCRINPPRTNCENAMIEMRAQHWSYLNRVYHPAVIAAWTEQGCMDVINRDLGYRLALTSASWPEAAKRGEPMKLELELSNLGYAPPFNPRPVYLILSGTDARRAVELDGVDPRRWVTGDHRVEQTVTIPGDLPAGRYQLELWFPDPAPALKNRPEYAIRLANHDLWQATSGSNHIGQIAIVDGP